LLKEEFNHLSLEVVQRTMEKNEHILFSAYLDLNETPQPNDEEAVRRERLMPTTNVRIVRFHTVEDALRAERSAARRYCALQASIRLQEKAVKDAETNNYEAAKTQGLVQDCGCCFIETPLNRMVSCAGDPGHVSLERLCTTRREMR
jgi:TRIAD3 protein (E3 ubiquitin-protein ligase RNF216)